MAQTSVVTGGAGHLGSAMTAISSILIPSGNVTFSTGTAVFTVISLTTLSAEELRPSW